MSVSAYEQQRLDNIAANNAVLAALGLNGDNSLKEKNNPVNPLRKVPVSSEPAVPERRSSRVSKKTPLYPGLTDKFMLEEEYELYVGIRAA